MGPLVVLQELTSSPFIPSTFEPFRLRPSRYAPPAPRRIDRPPRLALR